MYKTTVLPKPTVINGVRAARGIAVVASQQVPFIDFTVEENGFSAADTFTLTLPFFVMDSANNPVLAIDPNVASLLVNTDVVPVQIYVGYPSNPNSFSAADLTQVMDGTMDTARFQFGLMGETVTLDGRNKVGDLIDTKVVANFPNTAGSTLAQKFATEHGLQAQITTSPQFAGSFVNQQAAQLSNKMSEWDLLLFTAKRDHFICRVNGKTLYYGPPTDVLSEVGPDSSSPILLTYGYNIESLDIERSPHAARDISITVLSYNRDGKQQIKATASSNTQQASKIKGQLGQRGKYNIVKSYSGLTQQQAEDVARKLLARYSATQLLGNLTTAGNVGAAIDRKITLAGVGAGLDQDYFINKVVHRMSLTEGYKIDIGFSRQTDYTAADLANSDPNNTSGNAVGNSGSANSILVSAQAQSGRQFWANACAIATNDALNAAGIDVGSLGVANTAYAPDYQGIGTSVDRADLQPGDLVLTNWGPDPSRGGAFDYGHIGIYNGNGQFWNVSSSAGYVWTLTPLPSGQIQGQRL